MKLRVGLLLVMGFIGFAWAGDADETNDFIGGVSRAGNAPVSNNGPPEKVDSCYINPAKKFSTESTTARQDWIGR